MKKHLLTIAIGLVGMVVTAALCVGAPTLQRRMEHPTPMDQRPQKSVWAQ